MKRRKKLSNLRNLLKNTEVDDGHVYFRLKDLCRMYGTSHKGLAKKLKELEKGNKDGND